MLYIRADMNDIIATGHMMRCLSIADAARIQGEDTTFILADGQACELVEQRGYKAIVLHTPWNDMERELPRLSEVIRKEGIKSLLIDSYQVTDGYLRSVTSQTRTVYIDDINAFLYPVHAVICYANYWKKFDYANRYSGVKLYMGTEYVPLRQAFCGCEEKKIKDMAENVLLLSGGTDPYHVMAGILEQMDTEHYKNIDVICGRYDTEYKALKERYRNCRNLQIHQSVSDIDSYMKSADIAVSAGGTTLYELCACGTPAISYAFADNQLDNVHQFQEDEMIDYAGDARYENLTGNILGSLERHREDRQLRRQRASKMQRLVDGNGALRIATILGEMAR
ncbi:UDP-2,4-diacetamido-2,4,6-trideoxy-beta-L-altropyranose hydrolase [Lachnospiraceae bacterium 45-W7]